MFPNVRLMVVAILAAITGIGCGLGLFATFRVNHEPLARLAEGSPPLQLALDNRALISDARVPLEARLPVNGAAKLISVPVIIATPSLAPSPEPSPDLSPTPSPELILEPNPAPSTTLKQSEADSAITGDPSIQQAATNVAAEDQSNTASLADAVAPEQSSVTSEAIAPGQQEAVAAALDQRPDQQSAVAAATASTAAQMAAINAAAPDQPPVAKSTASGESKAVKPAARAARAAPPRRPAKTVVKTVAKPVRARQTVATVTTQLTYQYSQPTYSQPTYSQPTYIWADGTVQAAQPAKRIPIKRHGTAKKTAPAAQSDASTATAGLSGTQ